MDTSVRASTDRRQQNRRKEVRPFVMANRHAGRQISRGLAQITDRHTSLIATGVLERFRLAATWTGKTKRRELLCSDDRIAGLLDIDLDDWLKAADLLAHSGLLERVEGGWQSMIEPTIMDDEPPPFDWQMARVIEGFPAGSILEPVGEPFAQSGPIELPDAEQAQPVDRGRRSLPGPIIDRVRDGVSRELGETGPYLAAVSVAMSARQHWWSWEEYHGLMSEEESLLRHQLRVPDGKRDRGKAAFEKDLSSAWDKAAEVIAERPVFTKEHVRAAALAVLAELDHQRHWTATKERADRDVYRFAISECQFRGLPSPALAARRVADATGLSRMAASRSLKRLTDSGLLSLKRRGKAGATSRRANLYTVRDVLTQTYTSGDKNYVPDSGGSEIGRPLALSQVSS